MNGASSERREFYLWKNEKSEDLTECLVDGIDSIHYNMFLDSMIMNNDVDKVAHCFQNYITDAVHIQKLYPRVISKLYPRVISKSKTKTKKNVFPNNPWYDQECKNMKSELHKLNPNISDNLDEYLNLQKEYKREYQQNTIKELCNSSNSQQMWEVLKMGTPPQTKDIPIDCSELCDQFKNTEETFSRDFYDKII